MSEFNHKHIASLVIRAQHGNTEAFAELYNMTYNKVYNYACHYMKDNYLAQDAVQEVYILALKNLNKLNDPTLFIAWINQISFRVCYDLSKKNSENYGNIVAPELLEIVHDDKLSANPELHTEMQDEYERIHQAIDCLPATERQVMILRFYKEMKIDDIAKVLGISQSTVKRHINSSKAFIKQFLVNASR